MEKNNRWQEDTLIQVSRETRAKLKIKAVLEGKTLKKYLEDVAKKEENKKG